MKKKKCNEHPDHSEDLKRLNRLIGQLDGVKRMIEEGRYCVDIMNQLKAVRSGTKSVETNILRRHLEACVSEALSQKNKAKRSEKIEEMVTLFKKR